MFRELACFAWFIVRFPLYIGAVVIAVSYALVVGTVRGWVFKATRR